MKNIINKKSLRWPLIILGTIFIINLILSFPFIRFYGNAIPIFAPARTLRLDLSFGRVLGNHVIETEHGQIRLGHFSRVFLMYNYLSNIDFENFIDGRASHNLVVEGIKIPPNVSITFGFRPNRVVILELDNQEIIVSGVPLNVSRFDMNPRRSTADIMINFLASGYVVLADSTQIYFELLQEGGRIIRGLYMYKDDEVWVIRQGHSNGVPIKSPGETEFTRYREITFRPHWGEFIEGVLWEQW